MSSAWGTSLARASLPRHLSRPILNQPSQMFEFPVIVAGQVAVISTRDVLAANKHGAGGGSGGAAKIFSAVGDSDLLLEDVLRSMQQRRSSGATEDTDALLDDALKAIELKGGGSGDLD